MLVYGHSCPTWAFWARNLTNLSLSKAVVWTLPHWCLRLCNPHSSKKWCRGVHLRKWTLPTFVLVCLEPLYFYGLGPHLKSIMYLGHNCTHRPKFVLFFEVLTTGISETREEWKQPESSVWKFCAQNGGVVRGSNKAIKRVRALWEWGPPKRQFSSQLPHPFPLHCASFLVGKGTFKLNFWGFSLEWLFILIFLG